MFFSHNDFKLRTALPSLLFISATPHPCIYTVFSLNRHANPFIFKKHIFAATSCVLGMTEIILKKYKF